MRRTSSALLIGCVALLTVSWAGEGFARGGGGRGGVGMARGSVASARGARLGGLPLVGSARLRSGIGYGESPVFGYGASPIFGYGTGFGGSRGGDGFRGGSGRFGEDDGRGRDRFGAGYGGFGYGGFGYGAYGYGQYGGYGSFARRGPQGFEGAGHGIAGIPAPHVSPPAVYVIGRGSGRGAASARSSARGTGGLFAASRDAGRDSGVVSGARVIRVSGVR